MVNQNSVVTKWKKKSIPARLLAALAAIALLLSANLFSAQAVDNCNLTALTTIVGTGGTLDFNCATDTTLTLTGTQTVDAGLIVTLTNTGAGKVTISGDNQYQIFAVIGTAELSLTNLTLSNGSASKNGGAIFNRGAVTITDSTLSNNTTVWGGGAIYNNPDSTLTIINSSLYGNTSKEVGGAIFNSGGAVTITDSSLYNNTSSSLSGEPGGGAVFSGGTSTLTITNSSLYDNTTNWSGGAILNNSGSTLTITNSSLYGNNASGGNGGAIANYGNATVRNATFLDNTISDKGSGGTIYNYLEETFDIKNSLLQGSNICNGIITDGGYNLEVGAVGSYSCDFLSARGSFTATDAMLGAPGDNGGPTP
ncbi:hypothetical protein, partial [Candidatus Chlorohelix sp.]|uniref:hypothetical protein n=1 Tax=Candidatus Chlorohelix sp. TaxID=3139201 RepID=UPI00302C6B17